VGFTVGFTVGFVVGVVVGFVVGFKVGGSVGFCVGGRVGGRVGLVVGGGVGRGLTLVPYSGSHSAVGEVLLHHRFCVFSCHTTPVTNAISATFAVVVSVIP
jgi:hypothetical protein